MAKMMNHLNGGRGDGTHERRLASYLRPDLLVLDDFGLRPLRGREAEDEVINERYERGGCWSPATATRPETFVDNPLLASAALDRLAHRAHRVTITGPSYRAQDKPRPLGKNNGKDKKGEPLTEGPLSRENAWTPTSGN